MPAPGQVPGLILACSEGSSAFPLLGAFCAPDVIFLNLARRARHLFQYKFSKVSRVLRAPVRYFLNFPARFARQYEFS